jgi:hypothetical protein
VEFHKEKFLNDELRITKRRRGKRRITAGRWR